MKTKQTIRVVDWFPLDSANRFLPSPTIDELAERLKELQAEGRGSWRLFPIDYGDSLGAEGEDR